MSIIIYIRSILIILIQLSFLSFGYAQNFQDSMELSGHAIFSSYYFSNPSENNLEMKELESNQEGFYEHWVQLISSQNQNERQENARIICDQLVTDENKMAFAAYLGSKNSSIYDFERTGSGINSSKNLSVETYYQTLRNKFYIGSYDVDGPKANGVCGDSANMVQEFLKFCGYSCENDIDVVSYRTEETGHKIVAVKGKNNKYYSLNWDEVTEYNQDQQTSLTSINPSITNTGMITEVQDCSGKPKVNLLTPLGQILAMAHGQFSQFNSNVEFKNVNLEIKNTKNSTIGATLFAGSSHYDQMKVQGAALKFSFFNYDQKNQRLFFKINSSNVVAKVKRRLENPSDLKKEIDFDQLVFSPQLRGELAFNINHHLWQITPVLATDMTGMFYDNNLITKHTNTETSNFDFNTQHFMGVKIKKIHPQSKWAFEGESHLKFSWGENQITKGPNDHYRPFLSDFKASGTLSFNKNKKNETVLSLKYDELVYMNMRELDVEVQFNILRTTDNASLVNVCGASRMIDNPHNSDLLRIYSLGLQSKIKSKDNTQADLKLSVDYTPTNKFLSCSVKSIFKFNQKSD